MSRERMDAMSYVCDRCGKLVAATGKDPIVVTRLGKMHFECMRMEMAKNEGRLYFKMSAKSEAQTIRAPLSVSAPVKVKGKPVEDGRRRCKVCVEAGRVGFGHNARTCNPDKQCEVHGQFSGPMCLECSDEPVEPDSTEYETHEAADITDPGALLSAAESYEESDPDPMVRIAARKARMAAQR